MKKIPIFFAALMTASSMFAAGMQGAYNVGGSNADFESLYAACDSVSKAVSAGDITGDVDLLICGDLTEPTNMGIFNNTDFTITIRPDSDVVRTITFTQTKDPNGGPSGALMIGMKNGALNHTDAVPSQNIIIDGLADENATNKMVITTSDTYNNSGYLLVMYGQVTKSVVRNCVIENKKKSSSTYAFTFRSQNSGYGPKGAIVENCEMICKASISAQGVCFSNAGATDMPDSCIVRNNIIRAVSRGIFFNGANNVFVDGNKFYINGGNGILSNGVFGFIGAGTHHITNNQFLQLSTASASSVANYGVNGIMASGGGTWEITNNFFTGFDLTATGATKTRVLGIRCGNTCIVRHNTFILNELSVASEAPYGITDPITCVYAAAGGMTIENNNFVVEESASKCSCFRGTPSANTMSGNNFFIKDVKDTKAVLVDAGTSQTAKYSDLTPAEQEANRNIDPEFTEDYKFEANADMKVDAIEGITLDIEGNERGEFLVYPGCYEPDETGTSIEDLSNENNSLAEKRIVNGQLYIVRDGHLYNMSGMLVK